MVADGPRSDYGRPAPHPAVVGPLREDPRRLMPYLLPYVDVKTSVYLDEADARRLAMLAEHEGVSQASLLRKALRAYVPEPRQSCVFALDGVDEGPGGSVADIDDAALLEGFGG